MKDLLLLALLVLNPPLLFAEVSETRCYIAKVVYPDGTASVGHRWVDPNGIVTGIDAALREPESAVVLPPGAVIMYETIQEDGTIVREEWVEVPCPTLSSKEHP